MTSNQQPKSLPLVPMNPNSLKIKETQTRTFQTMQQESPPMMIGPQLPDMKPLRKKSALPPVPRFEEAEQKNTEMEIEMNKQETLNKFLMEIKGADFIKKKEMEIEEINEKKEDFLPNPSNEINKEELSRDRNNKNEIGEIKTLEKNEPIKEKSEQFKEKPEVVKEKLDVTKDKTNNNKTIEPEKLVFNKPDFKLNLDLINNMYKQQINPKKDTPTPKKSEVTTISNEKVLIPLKKKEIMGNNMNRQNEEYDPSKPNDYESLVNERIEKERKQKEIEKKSKMEIEEPRVIEMKETANQNFSLNNNTNAKNNIFKSNANKLVSPKSPFSLLNVH